MITLILAEQSLDLEHVEQAVDPAFGYLAVSGSHFEKVFDEILMVKDGVYVSYTTSDGEEYRVYEGYKELPAPFMLI